MKNLPNEKFNFGKMNLDPFLYKDVDFNSLCDVLSPCCLVFKGGYTKSITVGYHTNMVRLVSSLIILGPRSFVKYVKDFCSEFNETSELPSIIEGEIGISRRDNNEDIDSLLRVLSKNRDELKRFINLLKDHRPKEVSSSIQDLSELKPNRLFISYLEYYNQEIVEPFIVPVTSERLLGSFNLVYPFEYPSNYRDKVLEMSNKIDALELSFGVREFIELFKRYNANFFDPGYYPFMIYSLPLVYEFTYDLVTERVKRLVKLDVNEG